MKKALSIIIPVFNSEKCLIECLDSIIENNKNFEILLIDDGSTDESGKICDSYAKKDSRIRAFHKENGGVSSARNFGIDKAVGEYIMFVDSDDVLDLEWHNIIKNFTSDDVYYINERLPKKCEKMDLLKYIIGNNNENIFISGPYCKAFKTSFIKNNKLKFNSELINGEDMIFNVEALFLAKSFSIVNYSFYNYRLSVWQSTKKFNKKIIASDQNFHKCIKNIFKQYNMDSSLGNDIINFCGENAILTILNRISYIGNYKEAKQYFSFLELAPYNDIILNNNNIVFVLCKRKYYLLLYLIFRVKNRIKNIRKTSKSEFKKI